MLEIFQDCFTRFTTNQFYLSKKGIEKTTIFFLPWFKFLMCSFTRLTLSVLLSLDSLQVSERLSSHGIILLLIISLGCKKISMYVNKELKFALLRAGSCLTNLITLLIHSLKLLCEAVVNWIVRYFWFFFWKFEKLTTYNSHLCMIQPLKETKV